MRNLRIINEIECFITDFERGVISALETDYSNIQHFGCYFHFTKAIFRKIQEYGLATPYRENPLLKFFFRKIMSLPFIPADRIMEMIGQFLNDPQVNTARTGSILVGGLVLFVFVTRGWGGGRNVCVSMVYITTTITVRGGA